MKRLVCLLLTLALLPCAAALADLDEWEYYYGDGYTIRYPDYMDAYGVPMEETGWDMDIFADPEGTDEDGYPHIMLYVIREEQPVWYNWLQDGKFPDIFGRLEEMKRLPVDEPPVLDEPEEIDMNHTLDMTYAKYESMDGKWWQEAFIFDKPEGLGYVVLCRFPANDEGWYSDVLHWMVGYMEFDDSEYPGYTGYDGPCSFSLYDYNAYACPFTEVTVDSGEDVPVLWLFAEEPMTDVRLEEIEWDDEFLHVTDARTLFFDEEFTDNETVRIVAWPPEIVPNLRVYGVNEEGGEEYWYIFASGENADVYLVPGTADGC